MILAATFGATLTTYTFEKTFPLTTRLAVGAALGPTSLRPGRLHRGDGIRRRTLQRWRDRRCGDESCAASRATPDPGAPHQRLQRCLAPGPPRAEGARAWRDRIVLFVIFLTLLLPVFTRAIYGAADGIYTGVFTNRYDLPLHVSIIQGFVTGGIFRRSTRNSPAPGSPIRFSSISGRRSWCLPEWICIEQLQSRTSC